MTARFARYPEAVIARSEATKQSPTFFEGGDCFAPSGRSQ
jgi:hypothetical protein